MSRNCALVIIIALSSAAFVQAADKKSDASKQEQALREDALAQITGTEGNREPFTGIFQPAPDAIASDSPLPKVIGVLIQKGQSFPLMVNQKATLDFLTRNTGKEVTLMAKRLSKGDKNWLIADEVVVTSGGGATIIRKRGGL